MSSYAVSPFVLLAFVVGFGGLLAQSEPADPIAETLTGAARVIDADTLAIAGRAVRLEGIDAPEKRQVCRRNGRRYQCGVAATQALRQRIGGGRVTCAIGGRDNDGRSLGICHAADGTDLNGWLVEHGWALAYRRFSERYVPQEERARAAGAGLWAGQFVPPWAWRRGQRLGEEAG